MRSEEALAGRLRRALYVFMAEGRDLDHADEDELIERSRQEMGGTMSEFLEGRINFGTVKYRLDNAFVLTGCSFPPREVGEVLHELVLGVDVDDLAPAMRDLGRMPEDLSEAKGRLLDAEGFAHREASKGAVERSILDRLAGLLLCLWHLQAPMVWPLRYPALRDLLQEGSLIGRDDPVGDTVDYVAVVLSLSEAVGTGPAELIRLLPLLEEELPAKEECLAGSLERARAALEAGEWDAALAWYGLALSLEPGEREAMEGRVSAYQGRGLHMLAVVEAEALVELFPRDLAAHRRLLALYKAQRMIKDHNAEVRRFKALMLPGPDTG